MLGSLEKEMERDTGIEPLLNGYLRSRHSAYVFKSINNTYANFIHYLVINI